MKIYIEADSIATNKMSGIGHATLEVIRAFDLLAERLSGCKVAVIVPFGTKKLVRGYGFKKIRIISLPPGYKYVNYILTRTSFPFPADFFIGKGFYIFPNYKNWYVPFSTSFTFVHDIAFKIYPETIHPKNLVYMEKNFDRWLKRADKILTISHASADDIKHCFPRYSDKVDVVYLGANPKKFYRRSKAEVQKVLKKYNMPSDYILYLGNIEPRKNILRLLEAYKQYCDSAKKPKAMVIVGGDGWRNREILAKIQDMQTAQYRICRPRKYVHDEDLPALYSGATMLTHVAIYEGFGLPPVQAQACGTRLVVSDLPVFKETLKHAGVEYVNPRDVTALAEAISRTGRVKPTDVKPTISLTWRGTVTSIMNLIDKIKA